jgi:hypothetical protein
MARKRPTAVTVIAILNIVFGGLGLLCYACIGIGIVFLYGALSKAPAQDPQAQLLKDMLTSMKDEIPGFLPFLIGSSVFSLVMCIILIVAGIGLFSLQRWARVLCIFYSVATIATQIGFLIYRVAVLNPAVARWQKDFLARHQALQPDRGGMDANSPMNVILEYLGTGVSLTYAVILLVIMFLATTKAAFLGQWRDPYGEGYDQPRTDDYREEDDRWGR